MTSGRVHTVQRRYLHLSRGTLVSLFVAGLAARAIELPGQRLPDGVRPSHYELSITPDVKAATFRGDEHITLLVGRPTTHVTLNSVGLTFLSVTATAPGFLAPGTVTLDTVKEQATFRFPAALPAGTVTLALHYSGILGDQLRGFYLAKSAARTYAVTQFESTNARRAFPSFDEPAFKSTFSIALTVDAAATVISNSPAISDVPAAAVAGVAKHTVTFATTPKMSTYLVAFFVGDFQCLSGTSDGTLIRVCAEPGQAELGRFALSTAEYTLHFYNRYFGVRYPLAKLDMIALPDFAPGGMENFGAITYRETLLLLDPKTATPPQRKDVALTVAHEIAHQWFGDLVTMQWWDNLWLNEGFATWASSRAVAAWHAEWMLAEDDAVSVQRTLDADARSTTHAIRTRVHTPDEIGEMFDGISYGKAAALLAMVEHYVGADAFRQGIHKYLMAHRYANATAEDYWGALSTISHKPVDRIMSSFVDQPGVPLVHVTRAGGGALRVAQERFFLDSTATSDRTIRWTVPVCLTTSVHASCRVLESAGESLLPEPIGEPFANAGGLGYYRTRYSEAIRREIVARAESSLTPPERISLIGDQWALVRSGAVSVGEMLDLAAAIHGDPDVTVLEQLLAVIGEVDTRLATDANRLRLQAWIRAQFSPMYHALGPAPTGTVVESPARARRRSLLLVLLGDADEPVVVTEARSLADRYIVNQASIEPSLAQSALYVASRHGDASLYDRLISLHDASSDPSVRATSLFLTTHFRDSVLIARTLDAVGGGTIRNRDGATMLAILLRNRDTQDQTWRYIGQHWSTISENASGRLVSATGSFCSIEKRDEVLAFFTTHRVASADRALTIAGETIMGCLAFRAAAQPSLTAWLGAHAGALDTPHT